MRGTVVLAAVMAVALGGVSTIRAEDDMGKPESGRPGYDADNTGRNARDVEGKGKTSGDQSNAPADVKLTQEIRRMVVADDSLSTNAHNVKIITVDGVVTLRGPVDSPDEKSRIQQKAQQVAGVKRVDNQLEVVSRR